MPPPAELFDLSGKVAVVTGGSRGIGRAISQGLAEAGADVIICSRNLQSCEEAAAEISSSTGRRTWASRLHVGHWPEIEPFAERAWNHFGKVEEYWDKVVGVNLKGPFKMTAEFGTRMFEADGGSIVNLSSLASLRPPANAIPYGAAKAGLNAMARGFMRTWGIKVRVNTIIVGPFNSDVAKHWATIPPGTAETREMIGAVQFLASGASSQTTGTELRVAGAVV
jgi:NAD(P)-dependent dehydrogenase (short-subunit alcohol dehydrogenase family)